MFALAIGVGGCRITVVTDTCGDGFLDVDDTEGTVAHIVKAKQGALFTARKSDTLREAATAPVTQGGTL